jgi:hypothetical protein
VAAYVIQKNRSKCNKNNDNCSLDKPLSKDKNDAPPKKTTQKVASNNSFAQFGLIERSDGNFSVPPSKQDNVTPNFVVLNPSVSGGLSFPDLIKYSGAGGLAGLGPNNTLYGKGVTIAIISAYVNPNIKNEVASSLIGPNGILNGVVDSSNLQNQIINNLNIINLNTSGNDVTNNGWSLQQSLEVQTIMNLCPGATVYLIQSQSANINDIIAAIRYACDPVNPTGSENKGLGANVVNLAWGGDVACRDASGNTLVGTCVADQIFSDYEDVVFSASAGDSGTQWPMVNPYVLSVGGASIVNGQLNGWGSGGGSNTLYPGSFAQNIPFEDPIARMTPDIASFADPLAGVFVNYTNLSSGQDSATSNINTTVIGGTSLAVTLFTSFVALVSSIRLASGKDCLNQEQVQIVIYGDSFSGLGSVNPLLANQSGYNFVTGMGVPTAQFFHALKTV